MVQIRSSSSVRIGVVGDVHLSWDPADPAAFAASGYDLLLFVGDFASFRHDGLSVARSVAGALPMPALAIAGNHDGVHLAHMAAEVLGQQTLSRVFGGGQERRCQALRRALGDVTLGGYSVHSFSFSAVDLSIVVGRPHSLGGPRLAFADYLAAEHGIRSLGQSAERLRALVDEAPCERVLFLAHNGPTGLGARRHDIFGCDFRREEGDFGDPDLGAAVAYARQQGKRVLAVVAGHMHHQLSGGGTRRWLVRRDGVLYLNAARVPRIFTDERGRQVRHHVLLTVRGDEVAAEEVLVS